MIVTVSVMTSPRDCEAKNQNRGSVIYFDIAKAYRFARDCGDGPLIDGPDAQGCLKLWRSVVGTEATGVEMK